MYASLKITWTEAVAVVQELVALNPQAGAVFDETLNRLKATGEAYSWRWICKLADSATALGNADALNEQEVFNVGAYGWGVTGPAGISYVGQFTTGRFISVGIDDDDDLWLEADTGTGIPSRYFSQFGCIRNHLPQLMREW